MEVWEAFYAAVLRLPWEQTWYLVLLPLLESGMRFLLGNSH